MRSRGRAYLRTITANDAAGLSDGRSVAAGAADDVRLFCLSGRPWAVGRVGGRQDRHDAEQRAPAHQPRPRRQSPPVYQRAAHSTNETDEHRPARAQLPTLLAELATQTQDTTRLHGHTSTFEKLTQPTALQAEALQLIAHAPVVAVR